ncbi:MAG: hypothetical protein GXY38_12820 [Planctomycetes bacterium]|nr:hypothetical protein [Planctomycetota bacterium]
MKAMQKYLLALAAATIVGGCGQSAKPIVHPEAALPAPEDSPEFMDRVSSMPEITENDAMRGMLMFVNGKDDSESFEQRVLKLQSMNIAASSWTFNADAALTRGKLAYMVGQALNVQGGVMSMLIGPSQRYHQRELQFMGMMGPGFFLDTVSGGEFVAIMARADAYRQTGSVPDVLRAQGQ